MDFFKKKMNKMHILFCLLYKEKIKVVISKVDKFEHNISLIFI